MRTAKRFAVVGGGTAGWFAALVLRKVLRPEIEICVVESSDIGAIGVGEGGLPNVVSTLAWLEIDGQEAMAQSQATLKWGFSYEGWRTGNRDDRYFHLFHARGQEVLRKEGGFHVNLAAMMAHDIPLHRGSKGAIAIDSHYSQAQAFEFMKRSDSQIVSSIHFDSYRLARFLKGKALQRGVVCRDEIVTDAVQDAAGDVTRLVTQHSSLDVDFVVDASGLARRLIRRMRPEWISFADCLLPDRAIPFHMPHPFGNPALYSRAIAMNAGWMWQIPLQARVGAGYAFSSRHIDAEAARREAEIALGHPIEVQKVISFDPGCLREAWKGNVLALGLSSGFVEPLEATAVGETLEQLQRFMQTLSFASGVIQQRLIDNFNEANLGTWLGIRDFLRMHYDGARQDTPFWKDVAKAPYPDSYQQLKEVWQARLPRDIDLVAYERLGWKSSFPVESWLQVGHGMGVIPAATAILELRRLSDEKRRRAVGFVRALRGA